MEQDFTLQRDSELRFEVNTSSSEEVSVKLLDGKAEVFGTELAPNKQYTFLPGSSVAVFTWHGCRVRLTGKTEGTYIATETPMVMYLNTHGCLERLRRNADEALQSSEGTQTVSNYGRGPICMVVGPTDVGKSTVVRLLLNYAVRFGRRPIYVDLDVGQGSLSVPGTIGAVLVERAASVREGFSQEAPIIYNFGHPSPEVGASGTIINTCGWIKGEGYKSITHIAQSFEVDLILVLDQERLYNDLVRDIPFIRVVYLPKSGGVVSRSKQLRAEIRNNRIRSYFYGLKTRFHPHCIEIKTSLLKIYKIGAPQLPDSCMPADMKLDDPRTKLVHVEANGRIMHHLLALSAAEDVAGLLTANIIGFICVLDVDEAAGTMKILSPQPKPLPSTLAVLSQVLFMDSS